MADDKKDNIPDNVANPSLYRKAKAKAKRKFKVYPSAYANAYASRICAGKIKDPSGVKRKDFRGPKPKNKRNGGFIEARGQNRLMAGKRKRTRMS